MNKQDIIKLIDNEIGDFIVKDTFTRGKISGLRQAKVIIKDFDEPPQEPCEVCDNYFDSNKLEIYYRENAFLAKYCPSCGRRLTEK